MQKYPVVGAICAWGRNIEIIDKPGPGVQPWRYPDGYDMQSAVDALDEGIQMRLFAVIQRHRQQVIHRKCEEFVLAKVSEHLGEFISMGRGRARFSDYKSDQQISALELPDPGARLLYLLFETTLRRDWHAEPCSICLKDLSKFMVDKICIYRCCHVCCTTCDAKFADVDPCPLCRGSRAGRQVLESILRESHLMPITRLIMLSIDVERLM